MRDASASEVELFKTLANPQRTNFTKKCGKSVVAQALEEEQRSCRDADVRQTPPRSVRSTRSNVSRASRADSQTMHDSTGAMHDSTGDAVDKQATLIELEMLSRDGVRLSRVFTMADSLDDMLFELNRIQSNFDTVSAVGMMTDGLQLGMKGLEFANSRWGPILHLDGWSNTIDHDRERFKRVLTKLYKKHWRRGAMMTPEAELAMMLGGSAVLHHLQHKMGANPASNKNGIFGSFGNIMNMFGGAAKTADEPRGRSTTTQPTATARPAMRRPNFPSEPLRPAATPSASDKSPETTINDDTTRRERTFLKSFIVIPDERVHSTSSSPEIIEVF